MTTPECISETTLVGFFAGGLPVERVVQIEGHLDGCPACAALVETAAPLLGGASGRRRIRWLGAAAAAPSRDS